MIFEDGIELKLVINEDVRPIPQPKRPKRKGAKPINTYEAQIEATLVINEENARNGTKRSK